MSLFAEVVGRLDRLGIPCALIGAEALALRGVSRATLDRDLLATDPRALEPQTWAPLVERGFEVEIRRGDADDPLAGVVRFRAPPARPVDLVVGRHDWQSRLVERAESLDVGEARVAVPRASDLILLKLFAGGPQDSWDVAQLLAGEERETLVSEVEQRLGDLPSDARLLWRRILDG